MTAQVEEVNPRAASETHHLELRIVDVEIAHARPDISLGTISVDGGMNETSYSAECYLQPSAWSLSRVVQ
jgi:hypothetical protein